MGVSSFLLFLFVFLPIFVLLNWVLLDGSGYQTLWKKLFFTIDFSGFLCLCSLLCCHGLRF